MSTEPKYNDAPIEPDLGDMLFAAMQSDVPLALLYMDLTNRTELEGLGKAVVKYLEELSTMETGQICGCIWSINEFNVKRRLDEHPLCTAHTRAGLIVGFLRYWANGCSF